MVVRAQNSVSGCVEDIVTGETLIGASVSVPGSLSGAITDFNGNFEITNIINNKIQLLVSYIGYHTDTLFIDFKGQKHLKNLKVGLHPVTIDIDQAVIRGEFRGQLKALHDQKTSENIKNIVSYEQISQFPDLNAAEVVQRIPGITLQRDQGEGRFIQLRGTPPELTNFSINGEQVPSPEGGVRYVGLDVISADQIKFIEVTKVLSPDIDADGIAGNVNIITKDGNSDIPEIKASIAGGYNSLRKTGNYQGGFSYSHRYNKIGFHVNGNYYLNNQGSDNMEYKYEKGTFWGSQGEGIENYHIQFREVQLRHYTINRRRTGLSATLNYKLSDKTDFYLKGMYNNYSDEETRRRVIYDLDDAVTETYYLYGGIDRDIKERTKIQEISTLNFGATHDFGFLKLDYEGAWAVAREDDPDRLEAKFENPGQAIHMKFDVSDPDWPRVFFPDSANAVNAYNYGEYEFDELMLLKSKVVDKNTTAKINLTLPYALNTKNHGYLKFGGKVRLKNKERDVNAQLFGAYFPTSNTYPGTGPEISLLNFEDGFSESNLLNRDYVIDYIPSAQKLRDFYDLYNQFFIIDRHPTKDKTFGEDYVATEDIYACYGMVRHDIGNLMLLGGIRYERTVIDYQGTNIIKDFRGNFVEKKDSFDNRVHALFLPQVQLKYSPFNDINIRAALTYTYSRPNFDDVLPFRQKDRDEVKFGNPELEYPLSLNFDLLGEIYLGKKGNISCGLYYKEIDGFIFYYKRFGHEGDPTIGNFPKLQFEKAYNGKKAIVYGAEVLGQLKFDFLPGMLANFGLYTNYTYTFSEAFINKRYPANIQDQVIVFGDNGFDTFSSDTETEKIRLPGQAKHTANFALFYESRTLYAKLTANFHDDFLYKLGPDKDLDEYYDKSLHLDFNAYYLVTKRLKIFTDVVNLTNAPLKYYLGIPDRILKQEYYSWTGRLGIKLDF